VIENLLLFHRRINSSVITGAKLQENTGVKLQTSA